MRLFVGLPLAEDVRDSLSALGGGVPGANWVDPENLHLTLRFIGELPGPEVNEVMAALSTVGGRAFELTLAGVGEFGDRRKSRMLWAGVAPNPMLNQLQGRIESTLVRQGLEPERRRFHPHVTLARLRQAPRNRVQRFLLEHDGYRSRPFAVESFVLFRSHLGQSRAIYTEEAAFPLDGA